MRTLLVFSTLFFCLIGYAQPATPEICLVTVDTSSTFNIVVWQKDTTSTDIDYYNIYVDAAGVPGPVNIGSRDFDSSSVYEDHVHDPNLDSATYYLTAVDFSGVESGFSQPHSTMHLVVAPNGMGGMLCSWSHYWGNPVSSYECHRDSTLSDDWDLVFASSTGIPTSWNDNAMPSTPSMRYKLETSWATVCSTQKKAIGDFNSSRSNRTEALANPLTIEEAAFTVDAFYPNPVADELTIKGNQRVGRLTELEIYSNEGKLVKSISLNQNASDFQFQISTSDLTPGSYLVVIKSTRGSFQQPMIKQ